MSQVEETQENNNIKLYVNGKIKFNNYKLNLVFPLTPAMK
jgi:hypothetical protein